MDAPLRLAKPANPQLPEGFVNNPINQPSEIHEYHAVDLEKLKHFCQRLTA